MNTKRYIVKQIASEPELERFLKFRYDGLSDSPISHVVTRNNSAIDVNYYDRTSLHYGVYVRKSKRRKAVGYFRIILEEPTRADEWASNISERAGLVPLIEQKPLSVFPCLGAYPHADLQQEFYLRKSPLDRAGEISRFFISPPERSVKLSLQIIRSAFAIALLRLQYAFLLCIPDHSKAYIKFGFRPCPLSSRFLLNSAAGEKERVILYCRPWFITDELKASLQDMQQLYLSNGRIEFDL